MKKRAILVLLTISFFTYIQFLWGDARIVKRVSDYVLIETDVGIGDVGNLVEVMRETFDGSFSVGTVEILIFKNGKTAARVVEENQEYHIEAGDYIETSDSQGYPVEQLFGITYIPREQKPVKKAPKKSPKKSVKKPTLSYNHMLFGPIPGQTIIPIVQKAIISVRAGFLRATASYDAQGMEHSFNEGMGALANPRGIMDRGVFEFLYTFRKNWAFGIHAPVIISQRFELNPLVGIDGMIADYDGLTGIGDITVFIKPVLSQGVATRISGFGGIRFPSGSSFEDMDELNAGPTGTGSTAVRLGVAVDCYSPVYLISGSIHYLIHQQSSYIVSGITKNQKIGDEISVDIRMAYMMSSQVSIGAEASYISTGNTQVDGNVYDNTGQNFLSVMPMIGIRFGQPMKPISIFAGYRLPVSGTNHSKFEGITAGGLICF